MSKIQRAILSVTDKTGLVDFASKLSALGLGNGLFRPGGLRGTKTMGRCIFEDTNLERLDEKLARFDVLLCASHWSAELLRANCTKRVEIIFEGIDPSQFHPAPRSGVLDRSRFYIFSGGKVEFRKAHDLVLLAFQEFSRRHDEAVEIGHRARRERNRFRYRLLSVGA